MSLKQKIERHIADALARNELPGSFVIDDCDIPAVIYANAEYDAKFEVPDFTPSLVTVAPTRLDVLGYFHGVKIVRPPVEAGRADGSIPGTSDPNKSAVPASTPDPVVAPKPKKGGAL